MSGTERLEFSRRIEVRQGVDVFVAGGGPAGVAAAVTAARQGRSVFLAEGLNCLGGMGTAGMLPVFMPFADDVNYYAGGFGRELHDRLRAAGGILPDHLWYRLHPAFRAEVLKRLYDDMVEEAGVDLSLVTQVIGVEMSGDCATHVICAAKSGVFAVAARTVVDCTGDGDVCAWAGAPFEKGDEAGAMMGGTLCSLWADVDWERVRAAGLNTEAVLREALSDDPGLLPQPDAHLPGMVQVGPTTAGGNIGHSFGVDGTDERSLTRAIVYGRRLLPHYKRFYKERMKGFESVSLVGTASLFGVRESRRITGDYLLCRDDYDRCAVFEDESGRYNYWIDTHAPTADPAAFVEHMKLRRAERKPGDSYGIPYRVLTPRGLANVLVAGRCVSTDRALQSSIRVMPGCYITGQAAGMAAAMAVEGDTDTRGVPVRSLQERLKAMGAFFTEEAG